jgi:hypothetical protein
MMKGKFFPLQVTKAYCEIRAIAPLIPELGLGGSELSLSLFDRFTPRVVFEKGGCVDNRDFMDVSEKKTNLASVCRNDELFLAFSARSLKPVSSSGVEWCEEMSLC